MTSDDLKALVVTLAPKPAYNLVFVDIGTVDIDAVREFCCQPDDSLPEVMFLFTAMPPHGSLSNHIFSCHGLAANTTLFVAEGTFTPEQQLSVEELGYTVIHVMTDGRPITDCLSIKENNG